MKIIYIVYGNSPFVIKANYKNIYKSVELNYKCLTIMNNLLGRLYFKI